MTRKPPAPGSPPADPAALLGDLRRLIHEARQSAATAVNASLTLMYWRIGHRIHAEVPGGERAAYGGGVVAKLAVQLSQEFGGSFAEKNLRRMLQFATVFPDETIVVSLMRHLSWAHFLVLLPLADPLAREFYAEMCRTERWSVRALRERVDALLFERTALSKQPQELIRLELETLRSQGDVTPPLLLKDPYVLHFLGLDDRYLEKDLEDATVLPPRQVFEQKIQQALAHARARLASTDPKAP